MTTSPAAHPAQAADVEANEPFLPFAVPCIGEEEIAEVAAAMREGWVTTGPRTMAFERAFAEYVGVPYAKSVNSCTAALHLALIAHGVGPGDEVIVPSLTFAATANVVDEVGATPVFADVDERTLCLSAESIERKTTPRTKAVFLVHFAGLPCPIDEVKQVCAPRGVVVLEDAAHAAGTRYRGAPIGRHTECVSFSFYANKNMTTGEGGMLTTSNEELAKRIDVLRLHGMSRDAWKRYSAGGAWRYDILEAGYKYNLGDIASAIGMHQLRRLEGFIERRTALVARYRAALADLEGLEMQALADEAQGDRHAWHLFVVRLSTSRGTPSREEVMQVLGERKIGHSVHFIPVHTFTHYRSKWPDQASGLAVTERVADELLSLPLFPSMTERDVDRVVSAVREAFVRSRRRG